MVEWYLFPQRVAVVKTSDVHRTSRCLSTYFHLVGGIPTPLKNMSSSVRMIIPNIWKVIKVMFQTTNQSLTLGNMMNSYLNDAYI